MNNNAPMILEAERKRWDIEALWWINLPNPSYIIRREEPQKGLKILEEMELKDPEISHCLSLRSNSLRSLNRTISPGDPDNPKSVEIADKFENDLKEIDYDAYVASHIYARYYGFLIYEVPWVYRDSHFTFDMPYTVPSYYWAFENIPPYNPRLLTVKDMLKGEPITPGRFIVVRNISSADGSNPYGNAEGCKVYYSCKWANGGVRQWLNAARIIGGINAFGVYPQSWEGNDILKDALMEAVQSIGEGQRGIINELAKVEVPNWGRESIDTFFVSMVGYFNGLTRKVLIGAELTTTQGQGATGSYAMSQTHEGVTHIITEGDARLAERGINQLARLYTQYNADSGVPAPIASLDYETRIDQTARAAMFKTVIVDMNIPVIKSQVYEELALSEPGEIDEVFGGVDKTPPPVQLPPQNIPPGNGAIPTDGGANIPPGKIQFADIHGNDHRNIEARKKERLRDKMIGAIISAAPDDAYAPWFAILKKQVKDAANRDDIKQLILTQGQIERFAAFLKDAFTSTYVLAASIQGDNYAKLKMPKHFADQTQGTGPTDAAISANLVSGSVDLIEFWPNEKALKYLRARVPYLSEEYYALIEDQAHHAAFTVSNIESVNTIEAIQKSLTRAERVGNTFADWQKEMVKTLSSGELDALRPGQLETVFRTNIMSAYAAADEQFTDEVDPNGDIYDTFTYMTSQQENVCPICEPRHGLVFPRDDSENIPPLHFNCACTIAWDALNKDNLTKEKDKVNLKPPLKGFESSPAAALKAGL